MSFLNSSEAYTRNLLIIIGLALLVRVLWLMMIPVVPVSDSVMYHAFAQSISSGTGYAFPEGNLTAYWPVGTPAIYGALYYVFGDSYKVIVGLNLVVGIATLVLMMSLARQWFNVGTAYLVGLVYAFWPSQIQFTTVLASEMLFNVFMLLGLYFWYKNNPNQLVKWLLSAVFFVAAAYVRPIALLIPFILIAITFLHTFNFKQTILASIVTVLTMAILISPWAMRNYDLFGEVVLISTNGGPVFWMGNNPDSTGEYMPLKQGLHFDSEVERADYYKSQALAHIKEEPALFVRRMAKRFVDYYRSENIGVVWNLEGIKAINAEKMVMPLKIISSGYWLLLVILSIYALVVLIKERGLIPVSLQTPIIALIGYNTVLHTIIASGDRYHFPIIPFIGILAGYALFRLIERWQSDKQNDAIYTQ